jgi:hypothetical protein
VGQWGGATQSYCGAFVIRRRSVQKEEQTQSMV